MDESELIELLNDLDCQLVEALYTIACALECNDQSTQQVRRPSD